MAKKKSNLIGLGVLAALGIGAAVAFGKAKGELVKAKSGKSWLVTLVSNVNGLKTYDLTSPAGSFGPHDDLLVLRYSQQGSDVSSRQVVSVGAGVPAVMVTTAGQDFGIPVDPSRLPA